MSVKRQNRLSGYVFSNIAEERNDNSSFAVWIKGITDMVYQTKEEPNSSFVARAKGFGRQVSITGEGAEKFEGSQTTSSVTSEETSAVREPSVRKRDSKNAKSPPVNVSDVQGTLRSPVAVFGSLCSAVIRQLSRTVFGYASWLLFYFTADPSTDSEKRHFQSRVDYHRSDDIPFAYSENDVIDVCGVKYFPVICKSYMASDLDCQIIQMEMKNGLLHWIIMPNIFRQKEDLVCLVKTVDWSQLHNTFDDRLRASVHIPLLFIDGDHKVTSNIVVNSKNYEIEHEPENIQEEIVINKPFIFVCCDHDGRILEMGMFFGP
uniref:Uncharacterized protein n=1 Tax=Melicertus latisulcatus pemonivirus TaxID=2984278 RepID=A0A9C7CF49_9VIRU|nr:MAG: hypothetical protein [Melicertus latisulcatus pemonivirus]